MLRRDPQSLRRVRSAPNVAWNGLNGRERVMFSQTGSIAAGAVPRVLDARAPIHDKVERVPDSPRGTTMTSRDKMLLFAGLTVGIAAFYASRHRRFSGIKLKRTIV